MYMLLLHINNIVLVLCVFTSIICLVMAQIYEGIVDSGCFLVTLDRFEAVIGHPSYCNLVTVSREYITIYWYIIETIFYGFMG